MVTAGTYQKKHIFTNDQRLERLHARLIELANLHKINLQAWAVFSNHYHLIGYTEADPRALRRYIQHLHSASAIEVNKADGTPGRKVWFQYWDTLLTNMRSTYARIHYVHENPVRHGLVSDARLYSYCSAAWFEDNARAALKETVRSFPIDRVSVPDEF